MNKSKVKNNYNDFPFRAQKLMEEIDGVHKKFEIRSMPVLRFPHEGNLKPLERFIMFLLKITGAVIDTQFTDMKGKQ